MQTAANKQTADGPTPSDRNKTLVIRFNREVIEQGDRKAFAELVGPDLVNHAASPGMPNGPESMAHFILDRLRMGLPDIRVDILDQIAEGDKVTTRKVLRGTHAGDLMGIPATGRSVAIQVIDIIRLNDGKYAEHWGLSDFGEILKGLSVAGRAVP